MWWAGAGGVGAVIVILVLALNRSSLARRLGEKEQECESLKQQLGVAYDALASRVAADPSLEQLDRMHDTEADHPA